MTKLICRTALFLTLVAISVTIAGCGSDPADPTGLVPSGDTIQIELIGGAFEPAEVTVDRGTTVQWVNRAGAHTVTPDGHDRWRTHPLAALDQRFEHTFAVSGAFAYYCEPHASHGMRGVISVR